MLREGRDEESVGVDLNTVQIGDGCESTCCERGGEAKVGSQTSPLAILSFIFVMSAGKPSFLMIFVNCER